MPLNLGNLLTSLLDNKEVAVAINDNAATSQLASRDKIEGSIPGEDNIVNDEVGQIATSAVALEGNGTPQA